jgi:membrane-anchored protein YejM (alkaline phosphatase superfamily)
LTTVVHRRRRQHGIAAPHRKTISRIDSTGENDDSTRRLRTRHVSLAYPIRSAGVSAMASRPNIVVLMVDQLSARALHAYGHNVVKTPNIDSIAKRGAVFENCYTNFPLCAPARIHDR